MWAIAATAVFCGAACEEFYPVRDNVLSLDGEWEFRFATEKTWRTCRVPGCWETQGLAEPSYATAMTKKTGVYRRRFATDPAWRGRHVVIRFDGVMYGYRFSVNGRPAGAATGAYNLHQFEITDQLSDGDNEIEVTVETRPPFAGFDMCDDWSYGGIQRSVEIFTVGEAYLTRCFARCGVTGGDEVAVDLGIGGTAAETVRAEIELKDDAGRSVFMASRTGSGAVTGRVAKARRWSAETPVLYALEVRLLKDGRQLQRIRERVGFRSVEVKDERLLVNGKPTKLKGVNLNESDPEKGRAWTREDFAWRLKMMKEAHVDTIRTAHYPFHHSFYDLADEMGFYVIDEVPFAAGGRPELGKDEALPGLLERTVRTVVRDRNRPSVIIWSVGNENPYFENTVGRALDLVKELDPTRPRLLPHPRELTQGGEKYQNFLKLTEKRAELLSGHYLGTNGVARLLKVAPGKVIVQTEFAHAMGNGFKDFEEHYLQILSEGRLAGGCVWAWQDQGLFTDEKDMKAYRANGNSWKWPKWKTKPRSDLMPPEYQGVRLKDGRFIDVDGIYGADGVVYANGFPKESYHLLKTLYDPAFDPARVCEEPRLERGNWHVVPADSSWDEKAADGILLKVGRKDGICSLCRLTLSLAKAEKETADAKGPETPRLCAWKPHVLAGETLRFRRTADGAEFTRRWTNPSDESQWFEADFTVVRTGDGWRISYDLRPPEKTRTKFEEVGFAFDLPTASRIDWNGLGPWTSTPGKSLHNHGGVFTLHRDDIYFDGNRGKVHWAVTSDSRKGLLVKPSCGDVSFERTDRGILTSVNVFVAGYGSKSRDGKGASSLTRRRFRGSFEMASVILDRPCPVVPVNPFAEHYGR